MLLSRELYSEPIGEKESFCANRRKAEFPFDEKGEKSALGDRTPSDAEALSFVVEHAGIRAPTLPIPFCVSCSRSVYVLYPDRCGRGGGVTADLRRAPPSLPPFLHHKVTDCSFLGSVKGQGLFSEEKRKSHNACFFLGNSILSQ